MQGPQDAIRARITVRADHAHGEEDVEAALVEIEGELAADLVSTRNQAPKKTSALRMRPPGAS
jgi:hypothetical protein